MGSAENIYTVIISRRGDKVRVTCTCIAGEMDTPCKHRIALLSGDLSAVTPATRSDCDVFIAMMTGTRAAAIACSIDAEERKVQAAKDAIKLLKAQLKWAMNGD
jgi:hypothetical protein